MHFEPSGHGIQSPNFDLTCSVAKTTNSNIIPGQKGLSEWSSARVQPLLTSQPSAGGKKVGTRLCHPSCASFSHKFDNNWYCLWRICLVSYLATAQSIAGDDKASLQKHHHKSATLGLELLQIDDERFWQCSNNNSPATPQVNFVVERRSRPNWTDHPSDRRSRLSADDAGDNGGGGSVDGDFNARRRSTTTRERAKIEAKQW